MEQEIMDQVRKAIGQSIAQTLAGYDSPLKKVVEKVMKDHSAEIHELVGSAVASLLDSSDFKTSLQDAMRHKLAKTLVGKMDGAIEKQVNELRGNPVFRARLTTAIDDILKDLT